MEYLKYLNKYINGEELDEELITSLESNVDFMIAAINRTKDKNMYKMCDDKIKFNIKLLKYLIKTFKDDKKFIEEVLHQYLESDYELVLFLDGTFDYNKLEILETFKEYFHYSENDDVLFLKLHLITFYAQWVNLFNAVINDDLNDIDFGLGFSIIEIEYCTSDITKKFFAKNMVKDIFKDNEGLNDIEKVLHQIFKYKPSEGEIKLFMDFIGRYDVCLKDYVFAHIEDYQEYVKKFKEVLANWDNYEQELEEQLIQTIYDLVEDYREENYSVIYSVSEIMVYLGEELKLKEKFKKYFPYIYEECDTLFDERKLSIKDRGEFKKLKENILKVIKERNIDFDSYLSQDIKTGNTVIKKFTNN